jgi:hypothetical protein
VDLAVDSSELTRNLACNLARKHAARYIRCT